MKHRNTLRVHRKKWALSQGDIAHLLGFRSRSVVSVYEAGWLIPNIRIMVAYQFIFGAPLDTLFPGLQRDVEEEVVRRAVALDRKYRSRVDGVGDRVSELLSRLAARAHNPDEV
ncbi:MAG: hypothetical protein ACK4RV_13615 [Caulobacter sp.]